MTSKLATVALAALAAATLPAAASAQRATAAMIVTVDTQRIFSECTACKGAQTALQGQITSLQQRAQQLNQPLEVEANTIRTAVSALAGKQPDAALQKRIQDFQQRQQNAQQEVQGREQTVQRNRAYVSQQINTKLGPIFQSVMTTRGANLMLDSNATLAAGASLDVTNDVLTQLNQQLPSVGTTAPAPTPAQGPLRMRAAGGEGTPAGDAPAALPETLGPIDIRRIMAFLPHRYPMLLVDRVDSLVPGKSIVAIKAVSINEPFFQGHFPGRPIMPGVLVVEAMAQAAGVLALQSLGHAGGGKLVYFVAIEEAKFRLPVEPGVLLRLEVEFVQKRTTASKFVGRALVDGKLAAQAAFTALIADPPKD